MLCFFNHHFHMLEGRLDTPQNHILFFSSHPLSSLTISLQWGIRGNKAEMESEKGIPHKENYEWCYKEQPLEGSWMTV